MALLYSKRAWSSRIRQLRSQAHASGAYTRTWRSIFKDVPDYYDRSIHLVVSSYLTAEFIAIPDAIDQVPEFSSKRVTIYVTSGIYEELKATIPVCRPCLIFQGESRNSLWSEARKHLSSASTGARLFCLVASSIVTMTPRMYIEVVTTTSDPVSRILRTLILVVLYLFSRDVCCTSLLMETEATLVIAQGKNLPRSIRKPSGVSFYNVINSRAQVCHILAVPGANFPLLSTPLARSMPMREREGAVFSWAI